MDAEVYKFPGPLLNYNVNGNFASLAPFTLTVYAPAETRKNICVSEWSELSAYVRVQFRLMQLSQLPTKPQSGCDKDIMTGAGFEVSAVSESVHRKHLLVTVYVPGATG
jgi:hypothetical protein